MSDLTISARDVADSVGLPAVWRCSHGWVIELAGDPGDAPCRMSDPQTAFGVALKLDEWERVAGRTSRWAIDVAGVFWTPDGPLRHERMDRLLAMIARIRHIAMDHRVRRALGWAVEPGTLMQVFLTSIGDWVLMCPVTAQQRRLRMDSGNFGFLAGITDPAEALAAIHAEVCS